MWNITGVLGGKPASGKKTPSAQTQEANLTLVATLVLVGGNVCLLFLTAEAQRHLGKFQVHTVNKKQAIANPIFIYLSLFGLLQPPVHILYFWKVF